MSLLQRLEDEAEMILRELRGRCEQLANAFGANSHAHINPVVDALQKHVDEKKAVEPTPVVTATTTAPAVTTPPANTQSS